MLLKVGDDSSTDEILPAGTRVLPFRSNIPKIAEFAFDLVDSGYAERAKAVKDDGGHAVVGGDNYGQGSSREHAALAPRYLGLRVVLAKRFSRIHGQNLVNFGVLPLTFADPDDYDALEQGDVLVLEGIRDAVSAGEDLTVEVEGKDRALRVHHGLSGRAAEVLLAGGRINWMRRRRR